MRKQKFIHVSFDPVSDFEPRIPSNRAKDEDAIKKRICCILSKGSLQDDVIHALNASPCAGEVLQRIVSHGFDPVLHVYEFQSTRICSRCDIFWRMLAARKTQVVYP